MDRRDFLLSSTLAAATAATIASNNQVLAQTAEPGVTAERPNVPYEGSKLNRKLQIVNLLDLESGGAEDSAVGRLRLHLRRLRQQLDPAREHRGVQPRAHRAAGAQRRRQGRPRHRDPRIEAVAAGLHSADGQPWPCPRREGGGDLQGSGRGRHLDDDVDGVEPEPGRDRVAQSRPEMVPALCAERPWLYARAPAARQGRRLHGDRADGGQCLVLPARGKHPQRLRDAGVARPG